MNTYNVYRYNGEFVFQVQAETRQEALAVAWWRYFGDINRRSTPKDNGTFKLEACQPCDGNG